MKRACCRWRKENEPRPPPARKKAKRVQAPPSDEGGSWEESPPSQPARRSSSRRKPASPKSESEFEIDAVIDGPDSDDGCYQVSWLGYDSDENSREPAAEIPDHFIEAYKLRQKST